MNIPISEIINSIQAELNAAGLYPNKILADGEKHRCSVDGKPNGKDGEYCILHDSVTTFLRWRNYRTGEYGNKNFLQNDSQSPMAKAHTILNNAFPAKEDNPYLQSKGIPPLAGLKALGDKLFVPGYDIQGNVTTLQTIDKYGSKRFLKGGKVHDSFFLIDGNDNSCPLYLVEGIATGASVWLALNKQANVYVCFSAGNLPYIAKALRHKYPDRKIIICADNDRFTVGNPGVTKASEAAVETQSLISLPTFPDNSKGTDFNDLHNALGLSEVRRQLDILVDPKIIETVKRLKALTLKEFISWPIPLHKFLLYPILSEQGLVLLYAPRGLGKTYVALCIGLAVAACRSLFNWKAEEPHKVLYIDGEMPARTMQERIQHLIKAIDFSMDYQENFTLITPDIQNKPMPNLATPAGQAEIEPYLNDVSLLIIDNIATLCRAGRENETESWLPVQGWLLDLRRRGISVLIVHHAGKNGDQRGTSAKEDIMDTVINLRRPKDYRPDEGARFEVHLTKARSLNGSEALPFEAKLYENDDGLFWGFKDLEDKELESVKILLEQGMSIREIAEETDLSKSHVHRLKKKIESGN